MPPSANRYGPLADALAPEGWLALACCLCLIWTLVVLAAAAVPRWVVAPLPLLAALVATERALSHAYVHRHRLVREHLRSYRVQEALGLAVAALLLLLLTRLVTDGSSAMVALGGAFMANPLALVDRTAIVWGVTLLVATLLPSIPLELLRQLEPQPGEVGPAPGAAGYDEWLHSPARHFDHLGPFRRVITLLTAGVVAQVVVASLVWTIGSGFWARATAGALSLVCAVGAFVAISMANRQLRATRWLVERIDARVDPPHVWARSTASLVAVVIVAALLVPAALLIALARLALDALLVLGLLIMTAFAIPIPGALGGRLPPIQRPPAPFATPPPQAPSAGPHVVPPSWAGSALLLVALLIGIAFILLRSRDAMRGKGGLVRQVLAALVVLWRDVMATLRWVARRASAAAFQIARVVRRPRESEPRRRSAGAPGGRWTDRQVIRLLFQSLVREGAKSGTLRRPGDTARGYAARLEESVPEQDRELRDLTSAFEFASYSNREVKQGDVEHATSLFYIVRRALRAWARRRRDEAPRRHG